MSARPRRRGIPPEQLNVARSCVQADELLLPIDFLFSRLSSTNTAHVRHGLLLFVLIILGVWRPQAQ